MRTQSKKITSSNISKIIEKIKFIIKATANLVSSVLNKNNRLYGKKYMFDNCPETCWNSDAVRKLFHFLNIECIPGSPQWIIIDFEREYELSSFQIQFQGGFVGKDCYLEVDTKETKFHESFYPEDKNNIQTFKLKNPMKAKTFKFVFNESTDFFGRVIIYKLSLCS